MEADIKENIKNQDYREILKKAVKVEQNKEYKRDTDGWAYSDLPDEPLKINKLVQKGIIRVALHTNSGTWYRLVNLELTKKALEQLEVVTKEKEEKIKKQISLLTITEEDITEFKNILTEHDGVDYWYPFVNPKLENMEIEKKATLISLASPKDKYGDRGRIHVLLCGDPATGKSTLVRWVKEKLGMALVSHRSTDVGLTGDMSGEAITMGALPMNHNRHLIIEELDKFKSSDRAGLLECMEDGEVTLAGGGKQNTFRAETTTICTANRLEGFTPELISRFDFNIECNIPDKEKGKKIMTKIVDGWFREKGEYDGIKLHKFLTWIENYEPVISDDVRDKIAKLLNQYIDKKNVKEIDPRQYERFMRIGIAIARLNHRELQLNDVILAIELTNGDIIINHS